MVKSKDKQTINLLASVNYAYQNVPFYKDRIKEKKKIESIRNIQNLPIINKVAFEKEPVSRITGLQPEELGISFATTGSTQRQFLIHLTYDDFKEWLVAKARDALANFIGITDSDVIVNTFGFGLIQPGCEYTFAAIEAGAHVYPVGPGVLTSSKDTIRIIDQRDVTTVFATPSYALRLIDVALEMGINPIDLKIKRFLVTGETLTNAAKKRIKEAWGTEVFNVYGMAEFGVVGTECKAHNGLHILHDYLFPELTNIKAFAPAGVDRIGELVLTTIGKTGMPLIRYNTRDIIAVTETACSCGFQKWTIKSVYGRTDGMIKIKGKGIYPSHIEEILLSTPELSSEYQILIEHGTYFDKISIFAETKKNLRSKKTLKERLAKRIKEELGVNLDVKVYNYGKLPRSVGWKVKRIVTRCLDEPS